jgi:hypothetical protein
LNAKHAQKEVDLLYGIWLIQGYFKRHDPIEIVKRHCTIVKIKENIHEDNSLDVVFQRATKFHELSQRIDLIRNNASFLKFVPCVKDWWENFCEQKEIEGSTLFIVAPTRVSFRDVIKEQYYHVGSYDDLHTRWTTLR